MIALVGATLAIFFALVWMSILLGRLVAVVRAVATALRQAATVGTDRLMSMTSAAARQPAHDDFPDESTRPIGSRNRPPGQMPLPPPVTP